MNTEFVRNNNIHWITEKAFNQLTKNGSELFEESWIKIYNKTLGNPQFQSATAAQIVNLSVTDITAYILHPKFIKCLLFSHFKSKLLVEIIVGDITTVQKLLDTGYKPNKTTLQIAVLNNKLDLLRLFINDKLQLSNDLLMYSVSNTESENMYNYLVSHNLTPNLSVYIKAVRGTSLTIVKHISSFIALSKTVLETAFQTNCTDIIKFLIDEAITTLFPIDSNFISYPIMYGNHELIDYLESKISIEWHDELYYPALLSGKMSMIHFLEKKIPDIHENHRLDTSKTKTGKGYRSLLLDDMIYSVNGVKRMSHTVNYAIQSKCLETVKYICELGYGMTQSNIITAIKQGTPLILEYLLGRYHKSLDRYILHYIGIGSYIADKTSKMRILINSGLIEMHPKQRLSLQNYRQETVHLELLETETTINTDSMYDVDYLMRTMTFLEPISGTKLNHRLLTHCVVALRLNLVTELDKLYTSGEFVSDRKLLVDCLYLFGTSQQLDTYLNKMILDDVIVLPKLEIIMETLCYTQYDKLKLLLRYYPHSITRELKHALYGVSIMLSNTELLHLLGIRPTANNTYVKFAAESGDINSLKSLPDVVKLNKPAAQSVVKMGFDVITDKLDWSELTKKELQDLIRLAIESDHLETARGLVTRLTS